jgi:hypothetical protein
MLNAKGLGEIKFYGNNVQMVKKKKVFFLINFHPAGELETSICCVIKGSQSYTMASPSNALQMKAANSRNIQLLNHC